MTPEQVRAEQQRCNGVLAPHHFPPLVVDGVEGPQTRQAIGAAAMVAEFSDAPRRQPGRWVVADKTCQVMVGGEPDGSIRFVVPVTTGRLSNETRLADRLSAFRYEPVIDNDGWRNSTTFPVGPEVEVGGNMYRPIYFDRGAAIHGSLTVPTYPNSKGCVGMSPAHQDLLVSWLGLDDRVTTTWDAQRIDLTVTVRGRYPHDRYAADATPPPDAAHPSDAAHLPDAGQELLVRAALAGGAEGRHAWISWFERAPAGAVRFDHGSERLLPLVYRAMQRDATEIPGRELLAVRYRQSWYGHNRLVHRARPALVVLHDAGFDVMVVKGVSLAARFYEDRGVRPISDVDVVVREEQAAEALDVLLRSGWHSDDPGNSAEELLERSHSVGLVDGRGGNIDLHRRMMYLSRGGLDGTVWDRSVPTKIDNVAVFAPCAADELLLTVVHGWAWSPVSSIRWIPDVAAITPHMEHDDWLTLIAEARRRQVSYRVWIGLREVRRRFDVGVPSWVLDELGSGPFASFEAAEERWSIKAHGRVPPGVFAYFEYVRQVGSPAGVMWWPRFAKHYASVVAKPDGVNQLTWVGEKVRRRRGRKAIV